MCGIAGIVDLTGNRPIDPSRIRNMAEAIVHRGPDEDGFYERPGVAFASRRLSIIGLKDGRQPIHNEDKTVSVVFNGELFDYPEMREQLQKKGHHFSTSCDTELIPHLYEDHQESLFEHLRGQFAFALHDERQNRILIGRDRFAICPLYWTEVRDSGGRWLVFGSEIKAILASGMVNARPNPKGVNHLFTFFSMPGPVTMFEGIHYLPPGRYLNIRQEGHGRERQLSERVYWRLDFPEQGHEDYQSSRDQLIDGFESALLGAVTRRLRADVPVVSYLSGGVDSSIVVAMASKVLGRPIPCFTIRVKSPKFDETSEAMVTARHVGADPIVVDFGSDEVLGTYPELIRAAENPVVDTSCAALLMLARKVHQEGYKVALTGEGSDEWLGGYPWHKINRLLGYFDFIPGVSLSQMLRRFGMWVSGAPKFSRKVVERSKQALGGYNGWLDVYGLMSLNKLRFFSPDLLAEVKNHVPYEDLDLQPERMKRWHPFNRELSVSARAHLCGLLLNMKGDRVAMNSSVETRYPFLDEEVCSFLSKIPPNWKLRGAFKDKYILRHMSERWLPKEAAWRRKAMFRAPFDSFHLDNAPAFVEQLFSEESLKKTGYFDPKVVSHWRKRYTGLFDGGLARTSIEMGLVAVLSTQLWHHTFIDGSLADLPTFSGGAISSETNGQLNGSSHGVSRIQQNLPVVSS